ncbi:MAG: hypothetical protein V4604_01085 [Bacteroidota bacterium]
MRFRFFVLFLFASTAAFHAGAQSHHGNFGNSNRRNKVTITDLQVETQQWKIARDDEGLVKMYLGTAHDSVVVSRNGAVLAQFLAHNDRITSPCIVVRDENGNLESIDSFRLSDTYPTDLYYRNFGATMSMHREYYRSGIPSKACYKKVSGPDSLEIEWSTEGIMRRRKLNDTEYLYTPDGTLSARYSENDSVRYENDIIISAVKDTMMLNQWVRRIRNYSPKGTLLKESWFKEGKPVAVWREYTAEGVLVKTIKHPALVKAPESYEVMEMDYPDVFTYVSESAEYPGGSYMFYKYLNPELESVFSSGDAPLEGKYRIHFEITEEGKPVYLALQGENAASVEQSLKTVFEKMPKWKAGRKNGIRVQDGMVLTIDVSER